MDDLNQQQVSPQPQTPPTSNSTPPPSFNPSEQKHAFNNKTNWLRWIILIVFVALLSSAGTYFVLQSQKPPPSPAEVSMKAGPTPTLDPTANWKKYVNTKYGFSFNYPFALTISSEENFANGLSIEFSGDNYAQPRMTVMLYTGEYAQKNQTDLDNILLNKKSDDFIYSQIFAKKIDGETLYSYVEHFDYASKKILPVGGPSAQLIAAGMIKNVFYSIHYPYEEKTLKQDQEVFDQILSTFKFTSP